MTSCERELGELMNQIVSAMRRAMDTDISDAGLSRQEWAVLRHLLVAEGRGTAPHVDELFQRVEMPLDRLVEVLAGLRIRGYVHEVAGEPMHWRLTDGGRLIIAPLVERADEVSAETLSVLSAEERDRLTELLRRVAAGLHRD